MLINSKKMLEIARVNKFAIPAVNIINLISIKGAIEGAKRRNLPLIIALAEGHTGELSIAEAAHIARFYAKRSEQDIVLHYDHGYELDMIKEAIDMGFTSVMVDGSSLPFDENVRLTNEIVAYAKAKNVTVEGEIGHVGGASENLLEEGGDRGTLTTVEEAGAFAKATNVDSLAISIGTAHGEYIGTPELNFNRLEDIAKVLPLPLVLHGGSGSGDENLSLAATLGISKVNICTDMFIAARNKTKDGYDTRSFLDSCALAREAYTECLSHYYDVFRTKNVK